MASDRQTTVHATTVFYGRGAVALVGPAGCGKSGTALELMSRGATLIADDRTVISRHNGRLYATTPARIAGRIEARKVGILNCDYMESARLVLVADLNSIETDRLPKRRQYSLLGCEVDLIRAGQLGNLAAVILQYLKTAQND